MYNINNGDILINDNGQIFQIIYKKESVENYFVQAISFVDNEIKEVVLLRNNLTSFRNITGELKLLISYFKEHFDNNYIELEIDNKKIKLDLLSALKKLEELKKDFNIIENKELEIQLNVEQ